MRTRRDMALRELPEIVYDEPPQIWNFPVRHARLGLRDAPRVLVAGPASLTNDPRLTHATCGRSGDPVLPHQILAHFYSPSAISREELSTIDALSASLYASHPACDLVLVLDTPPEPTDEQLALVAAMVRPCDYVLLRVSSSAPAELPLPRLYLWKTDGGIPPAKILVDWIDASTAKLADRHSVAGYAASSPAACAQARDAFPLTAFRLDRASVDRRRGYRERALGRSPLQEGTLGLVSPFDFALCFCFRRSVGLMVSIQRCRTLLDSMDYLVHEAREAAIRSNPNGTLPAGWMVPDISPNEWVDAWEEREWEMLAPLSADETTEVAQWITRDFFPLVDWWRVRLGHSRDEKLFEPIKT